jgi:hypothetical protein
VIAAADERQGMGDIMGWIKLDDQFFRHPKVVGAGRDDRLLYLAGLCYCGANLTDGLIPSGAIRLLAAEVEIAKPTAAAARLVEAGLWERAGADFRVHDYLEHNRSSERVRAEREAAAERMQRKRSGEVRANIDRSSGEVREQEKSTRREETDPTGAKDPPAPRPDSSKSTPPPSSLQPYRLFQVICEELGADEAAATKSEKQKQLGVAKHLIADGVSEEDVRGCVRYLQSQTWRTAIIDLVTVRSEVGKWRMAGRPVREAVPINGARATSQPNQSEIFQRIARGEL